MADWKKQDKIFITCALYLSPYLKKEVEDLGYTVTDEKINGVELFGTLEDCVRLNFFLRTGTRILYHLQTTICSTLDFVYKDVKKIQWDEWIEKDKYFSVDSFGEHDSLRNTMFLNLRVKDAIADFFMEKFDLRPDTGPDKTHALVYVYWKHNTASVYLDTSGVNLTKHGYRKIPMLAPLQENLAAAMILSTRWDKNSSFINPMCGSGTLAIEAALIACNRANGLLRDNYGFMHLIGYDNSLYEKVREEAKKLVVKKIPFRIIATDINKDAVEAAQKNANTAGVEHLIDFEVCDFMETEIPEGNGVVLLNPPYGERMPDFKTGSDEDENLFPLYKSIGEFLKHKCKRKTGYVFTGNFELLKGVGLKAKRKIPFTNAKIECKLFEYELYEGTRKNKQPPVSPKGGKSES